jgi:DNA polymerase elongation subunit (family B)
MSNINKDPEVEKFLYGKNNSEGIINIEYDYKTNYIFLIIEDFATGKLKMMRDQLRPFVWAKDLKKANFYNGDKKMVSKKIAEYGIKVETMETGGIERNENGFKYLVSSTSTWNNLIKFFSDGGIFITKNKTYVQYSSPVEQYLISTGKRLFKGFPDYNSVHRYIFDIETTGLDPKHDRVFMIGAKTTRGFEKLYIVEKPDDDTSELGLIIQWAKDLNELKPSIIAGYNSENFDFYFLIERLKILGSKMEDLIKTLTPDVPFKRKESSLKLANEVEMYEQTLIWGLNVIDIIHSVRRAQAINSEIRSAGLKYICKFSKIAAPNRVYIPEGHDIFKIYNENKDYWFNEKNGEYRVCEYYPDLVDLDKKHPKVYKKVNGQYIVKRYLMDDLWETLQVDSQYNQASYLMAQILPATYHRVSTMGTAGLWKMLMMAWSYENKLAVPSFDQKRDYTGGLSRLLCVGFIDKIVKIDFNSLYPSIQITHGIYPECDITKAMDKMLRYFHATRTECKAEGKKALKAGNEELATMFDRKQLPIKILNNSQYGALCAPTVYPWSEMDKGEEVTCRGRNYLRKMIEYFTDRKFKPILIDTDGCNFSYEDVDLNFQYIGKGLNWKVDKDKVYTGLEAYCAEFNDTYQRGVMALDIDELWETNINLARKNYAGLKLKDGKQEKKLVGNSIKSKTIPTYIEEFIDDTFNLLLDPTIDKNEKGQRWIQLYYDEVEKIYNKDIPLIKIANKSKVKQTVEDYRKRSQSTNKNGGKLPQLTHMELIIEQGIHVNLGDVIYYVNDATKASHGDCGKHKKHKDDIEHPNSYLVSEDEIKRNPDLKGSYNVPRAIAALNKKVKLLLVIYKPEIRDQILIKEPSERKLFTHNECELINGIPINPEDQDDLVKDVVIPENKEVVFWDKYYKNHPVVTTTVEDIQDPSLPHSN